MLLNRLWGGPSGKASDYYKVFHMKLPKDGSVPHGRLICYAFCKPMLAAAYIDMIKGPQTAIGPTWANRVMGVI